ncbi:MAG: Hsp20/alpha crystallin family protein [Actinobacteria bacterium]|nr:Hsp20/alpha crystallin family protein [Actinomycetota bacterium]MCI0543397.1 Hsp20/alpha crystallin family protein [Actinomycetota bacterium]MCI0678716.1 Hsp20/alpha crystallin family protein [Actinomycetota bacterium]
MLMRFDPFADLDRLTRQAWGPTRVNYMPADAYRLGDRFYVHVDLPGVDQDSIDVTVEKNTLTISAERRWERDDDTQVLINERPFGSFSRQFFLGDSLDTDRIEAGYDHGVLTVSIPVAETAKARKIEVGTVHEALAH